MEHKHSVLDKDTHFIIDPATRAITTTSEKLHVMQFDHNSERLTFEMPRYIEGHDMSVCNQVEAHFLNIDGKTKDQISGHRVLEDFRVSEEDESKVVVSWNITEGATSATGRSEIKAILIDGVKREEYAGYCNTLDVYWTNHIQATNTKKEDGNGREVLKEEYHLHFNGETFEIENDVTALEEVEILRYYGLQIAQGVAGYSYDISYIGSHNNVVQANGNSKSADTTCREVYIRRKDFPVECRFGLHPVGLGTFYCNNWYSAFDTEYGKSYFFMICPDKICRMATNQQINFKGYYKFRYCE